MGVEIEKSRHPSPITPLNSYCSYFVFRGEDMPIPVGTGNLVQEHLRGMKVANSSLRFIAGSMRTGN
jgi:hypothetical protein